MKTTIEKISTIICPDEYTCSKCGKSGNINNMIFIKAGLLMHANCYKKTK